MTPVPLLTALIIMKVRDVCTQKSKILIDQDSPLDSEDSHDKNGSIVKTSKLEEEDPENESRCPLRNIFPDEVKEAIWLAKLYNKVTGMCWQLDPNQRCDFSDLVKVFETLLTFEEKEKYKMLENTS